MNGSERTLYDDQVAQSYKHMPEIFAANVVNATILAVTLWRVVEKASLVVWFSCLFGVSLFRLVVYLAYKRSARKNEPAWGRLFVAGVMVSGFVWGLAGLMLFPQHSPTHQIFIAFVLGGMAAGAVVSSSVIRGAFMPYCLLALSPITIMFFRFGDEVHTAMGIMGVVFSLVIISLSRQLHNTMRSSLMLGYANLEEIRARRKTEQELKTYQNHLEKIVRQRTDDLAAMNEMFVNLSLDPQENIDLIVSRACELLDGVATLYNRLDDEAKSLIVWSAAHAPGDFPGQDSPGGHICYEATIKGQNRPVIIEELQGSEFELTDVNVRRYGLRAYLGYPVLLQNKAIGALCVVDVKPRRFTQSEIQIISTLAKAISLEEERKKAIEEREQLADQLRQRQKIEAVGTLAGGIAHNFNNILAAIVGYTEIAKMDIPTSSASQKDLDEVLKASNRAKDLVQQILTFSRKGMQQLKAIDPVEIVEEALGLMRATIPASVAMEKDLDGDAGSVIADPTQLHQVVVNLCTNACQAMEGENGVLRAELKAVDLDVRAAQKIPDLAPGPYIRLSVSDTGHGIDGAIQERIFEPYFTTKEQGKGSGMGLAVALGIVKSVGGAIVLDGRHGKGSKFDVYLPRISGGEERRPASRDETLPTGSEKIMVIDDEPAIAFLNQRNLETLGYQVTSYVESQGAYEAFKSRPEDYNLIITDQTMPRLSGMELAGRFIAVRPDIRIILLTGCGVSVSQEKAREAGIREILLKPVERKILAQTVRNVLDEKREGG